MASLGLLLILEFIEPTLVRTSEADGVNGAASPMVAEEQTSDQSHLLGIVTGGL